MRLTPRRLTCAGLLCTAEPLRQLTIACDANHGLRLSEHAGVSRVGCADDAAYDVLACPLQRCAATEFIATRAAFVGVQGCRRYRRD